MRGICQLQDNQKGSNKGSVIGGDHGAAMVSESFIALAIEGTPVMSKLSNRPSFLADSLLCFRGKSPVHSVDLMLDMDLVGEGRLIYCEVSTTLHLRSQLQRLMDVMANQRLGDPPNQDEVRLRHAPGRMVIDVHFRRPLVAAPVELGGCVVEILNAYSKPGCS